MTVSPQTQARLLANRLSQVQPALDQAIARISSGSRIVRPSSDPVAVGMVARHDARITRLQAAEVNVQNGVSRTQVADSLMGAMGRTLTRMGELASLAQNPVQNQGDRELYADEFKNLQDQLRTTIGGATSVIGGPVDVENSLGVFNGLELFGAAPAGGERITLGADADSRITLPETNLREGAMLAMFEQDADGNFTFDLFNAEAVAKIDSALDQLAVHRASTGAVQSRLEFAGRQLSTERSNLIAAISPVEDADIARESTMVSRQQFLNESHTAMLAQAREMPHSLIALLQA